MRYVFPSIVVGLLSLLSAISSAQEPGLDHTMYRLPIPGGFVVTPDLVELIVSLPESAELVYYNTMTEKETRRVEMEFPPSAIALVDKSLYVVGKGSSIVHDVDLKTGKENKQYSIPGDGIARIAAHAQLPLLFVSTVNLEVYVIDRDSGKAHKTRAIGDQLAVSPDGKSLFTGMQPRSSNGVLVITESPDGSIHYIYDSWGIRSALAKYAIKGHELKLESSQANAAVNGYTMHLSPDGKRLMMTGGGGWRPPAEGGTGGGYVTAIYDTGNLASKLGEAPHAEAVVYHPVLKLAAASGFGHNLMIFDGRTFKVKQTINFSTGGHGGREVLAFVGKGTKVALYNGANPKANNEGLHFFSIDLSNDERAQLTKAFGPLPKRIEPPKVTPASPPTTARNPTPTPGPTGASPEKPASKTDAPKAVASATPNPPKSKSVMEATAGFNDAKGMNSNQKANSPYLLGKFHDKTGSPQGLGEHGWDGTWSLKENLRFQKEVVAEGDGAMYLIGTANTTRRLADIYDAKVTVEQTVRLPKDGDLKVYVNQKESATAAMWLAGDGKFTAIDGVQDQYAKQNGLDTGFVCEADTWYKVVVEVDFSTKTWTFSVDDKKFDKELKFRGRPEYVQEIGYLSEKPAGAYVDAVKVSVPRKSSKQPK